MKTKSRALSTVLIVCTFMQAAVPLLARQAAPPGITITSMDRGSVRPFDRLVIRGSGFQPATAAISVLFVPKQHGVAIVIPVHSANTTQVEVIVPTFLDPTGGNFGFGQADVQVVQVTRDHVMSSNVLSGLDVAPLPTLPDSVGAGRVTRAFMRLSLEFLTAAREAASPQAQAAFKTFQDEQALMLAKVELVVANPGSAEGVRTIDSSSFVVNAAMLKASDRLIAAYLNSIAPLTQPDRLARDRSQGLAFGTCSPDTGDSELDQRICDARIAGLDSARKWLASIAATAGALAVVVAIFTTGPLMMGLGAAAGAGLVLAGAAQLAYMCQSGQLAAAILASEAPPPVETFRDHSRKMLEGARDTNGVSITSASAAAADSTELVFARVPAPPSLAPKGGTTLAAPSSDQSASGRDMITFQGSGATTVTTRLKVPSMQSTQTLAEARTSPPLANGFDGAYNGLLTWSRTDGKETSGGQEVVAFTVGSGRITATSPFAATGSVNSAGVITGFTGVSPAGFSCSFSGVLGIAASGGSLGCAPKDGLFTWGSWSAARPTRP